MARRSAPTSAAGPPAFPARVVDRVAAVPGVRLAQGSLFETGWLVRGGKRVTSGYAPGIVMSDQSPPFDPLRYDVERPAGRGEVSVSAKLAEDEGLRLGERVRIAVGDGTVTARLAGVFRATGTSARSAARRRRAPRRRRRLVRRRGPRVTRVSVAAEDGVDPRCSPAGSGRPPVEACARAPASRATRSRTPSAARSGASSRRCCSPSPGRRCWSARSSSSTRSRSRSPARPRSSPCCAPSAPPSPGRRRRAHRGAAARRETASVLGLLAGLGIADGIGRLFDATGLGDIPAAGSSSRRGPSPWGSGPASA